MQPKQEVKLPLDRLATVPGDYTAQASTAYLYYTSEHKTWVPGTPSPSSSPEAAQRLLTMIRPGIARP